MTSVMRKMTLTAHVVSSVGWLGAVVGFLVLAVAGLSSHSGQVVRAAYIAMDLTAWFAIVPLCLTSLVTGIAASLGTEWGLARHYWVLVKLVLTVPSTALLLLHARVGSYLAEIAARTDLRGGDLMALRIQLTADAGVAIVVLLVATTLSMYKPRARTPFNF